MFNYNENTEWYFEKEKDDDVKIYSTNEAKLEVKRGEKKIKQHKEVTYLGCIFDSNLSGEGMAVKVLNKVNSRLRFFYRKQNLLNAPLRRLLCNALIQPHFDYACHTWTPIY